LQQLRFDTSSRKLSHPQLDAGQRDGTGAIEIDQFAGTERFEELTLYPYIWLSRPFGSRTYLFCAKALSSDYLLKTFPVFNQDPSRRPGPTGFLPCFACPAKLS